MRRKNNECLRVEGKISFENGGCALHHKGDPEDMPPMEKKLSKEEAHYEERTPPGFGCRRCEYSAKAKKEDGDGRASWCSFWGLHVIPNACCAMNDRIEGKQESKGPEEFAKEAANPRQGYVGEDDPRIRQMVEAEGGDFIGIDNGYAWFVEPQSGSTCALKAEDVTPEAVGESLKACRRQFRLPEKVADTWNAEGYWAGEGNAASGILPICAKTGRIGLSWRSGDVDEGNCWGTIGGAVKRGMTPEESAREELSEETGYRGAIRLHPAYVYRDMGFQYYNFLGEVLKEFGAHPEQGHEWETGGITWAGFDEAYGMAEESPSSFHSGLLDLFANSREAIRILCGKAGKENVGK